MPYEQILVLVDGTRDAEVVCAAASGIAQACGARVTLLHVQELPPRVRLEGEPGSRVREALEEMGSTLLMKLRGAFPSSVPVETALRFGPLVTTLERAIAESGAQLVVVGSHERRPLRRLVLGSVAEPLLRSSPVPLLVVPVSRARQEAGDPREAG